MVNEERTLREEAAAEAPAVLETDTAAENEKMVIAAETGETAVSAEAAETAGAETEDEADSTLDDPQTFMTKRMIRGLVACYILYVITKLVRGILSGEMNGGEAWIIWAAIVIFLAGVAWLLYPEYQRLKENRKKR